MAFSQISILGVGLLGGSIGLAMRKVQPDCRIIGYGHRQGTLDRAVQMRAIDRGFTDPAAAIAGSDLVILCTPVGAFENLLKQIAPALAEGCIVTDVGSTKRSVVELAEKILPPDVHFVGSHPMAGSEKRGVEYARGDLFRDATCILTPTLRTSHAASKKIATFWESLGMNIYKLSPEDHDRILADVSHLPHLLAAAIVAIQPPESQELRGKGFLDATRIATGDASLWRDILIDNSGNLRDSIGRFQKELQKVLTMLEAGDGEGLRKWLNEAAEMREQFRKEARKESEE
jgi:prephenate dehydrogenase